MNIERLTPDEGTRLRAIRLRALRDAPDAFGTTFEEAEPWPAEVWRRQLEELATFVAVMAGQDVGLVRGAAHDEEPDSAQLISMWVAPEARGKGASDALIDAVVAWARGEGFRRLLLDVVDDNAAAVALYARRGFVPTGVVSALPAPREHIREHQRVLVLRGP